jgi:hypothetical protein
MLRHTKNQPPSGSLMLLRGVKKSRILLAAGVVAPLLAMTPAALAERLPSSDLEEMSTSESCQTTTASSGSAPTKLPPDEQKECRKDCRAAYPPGKKRATCVRRCGTLDISPTL